MSKTNGRKDKSESHGLPHLKAIEVRDFKSLKSVDVEFGQVNVFVGANGSGKSNLLEAIGLLGAAVSGRIDDPALLRRGVRPGVPALYKSSFKNQAAAARIGLSARSASGVRYSLWAWNPNKEPKPSWTFWHETIKFDNSVVASRGPNQKATVLDMKLDLVNTSSVATLARANPSVPADVRSFFDVLEDYAIFAPVTPVLRGIAPDSAPRNPVGLYGGQLPEAVGLLLGSAKARGTPAMDEALGLIDWAEGFSVSEPSRDFMSPSVPTMRYVLRFHDRFMAKKRNVLSGYDASEGALYALFLIVLAVHGQSPKSFAVDNFDQALNPRAAKALTSLFVKHVLENDRQVFLTTHNAQVLDGLPLDDDRVRLFTVDRDPRSGHTVVKRVNIDLIKAGKQLGNDAVSRLWVMGRFGGMPNV